jgi:transposase
LSLFAALNTATGEVLGTTAPRHTSAQFVAFLADVVASQPEGKEVHVICDNVSARKTDAVDDFLTEHANVQIHYTPTYSSWLNQVENWFSRIQRDVIARGVFTNVKDLDKKLMRYIRQYNKNPKPIKWKYDNPNKRIRCNSSGSLDWSVTSAPSSLARVPGASSGSRGRAVCCWRRLQAMRIDFRWRSRNRVQGPTSGL